MFSLLFLDCYPHMFLLSTTYLLVLTPAFTRGGLSRHHEGRTMVMFHVKLAHRDPQSRRRCIYWPVRFESTGASALHILLFGFNPGDARDRSLIGRGVLIAPPFVGPLCRSAGAQSTTQPWHSDPLTPFIYKLTIENLPSIN